MRIDQINHIYEAYKKQSVSKTKQTASVQKKDEVMLSGTAKDFQTVYKLLSTVPDIRQDKVDALKEKLNSGNYTVNAEEVAEKIVSHLDIKG